MDDFETTYDDMAEIETYYDNDSGYYRNDCDSGYVVDLPEETSS